MSGEKTETPDSHTNALINEKDPKLKIRLRLSRRDEALQRDGEDGTVRFRKPLIALLSQRPTVSLNCISFLVFT